MSETTLNTAKPSSAKASGSESWRVAVVGGCGHVGLPLGIALAQAGVHVVLIDLDADKVRQVLNGSMPFYEEGADEELPQALASGRLQASTSLDSIPTLDAIIVTVGTPVDEFLNPSVRTFDGAVQTILDRMVDGQLLILRSTVFPGVTARLARIVESRRQSIDIAYCPERIAQGFALRELKTLPQLVGGVTPQATRRAVALFQTLGLTTVEITPTEAELAKLFANAYRYMNFAISNQFYMIAQQFGVEFERIHEAATYNYPRLKGFAGSGFAGGPCLLKDTMQLSAFNHTHCPLGQAAMIVNEGLPSTVVERAKARCDLRNSTAGILGMAFKGNSDDIRDSLSYKLRKLLELECPRVLCTDPYVKSPDLVPLDQILQEADILFVGACHQEYRHLQTDKLVIDVFGFVENLRQPVTISTPAAAATRKG
jgi:UDP-N-acetyl-D-mannosaminuronic acid dehydrogenase